ncbi:MAG: LPS export ABC transporter permease LptG [Gammaproteobacteria bacterium]
MAALPLFHSSSQGIASIVTSIIDRYLFRTILTTILIALFIMVVLNTFFNFINELENYDEGRYGLTAVFQYLFLTLPRRVYETLPVALLVGGLLGMGGLANSSELVIMRATGWSKLRLSGSALRAGLVLSILALLLGEFIAPYTERIANEQRFRAQSGNAAVHSGHGFWARDGDYFVNIGAILPGPQLIDITIFEVDRDAELKSITQAANASFREGQWLLNNVRRNRIKADAVLTDSVPQIIWSSVIGPDTLKVLAADPIDLSMRDLLTYIEYLHSNALDGRIYELAFWTKAIAPFTHLSLLLLVMPFAFGAQRSIGMGQRLLIGALLGLAFFLINRMLGNLVLLYNFQPWLGASLPTVLFYVIGASALHRQR